MSRILSTETDAGLTTAVPTAPIRTGGWRRFLRNPLVLSGTLSLVAVLAMVLIAWLRGLDALQQNLAGALASPSGEHWAGTDHLGRDVFARVAAGAPYSIGVAGATIVLGSVVGTTLGLISGILSGPLIRMLNATLDFLMAFPLLMIAILAAAAMGNNLVSMVASIGIALIPRFALVVRSQALGIAKLPYVEAAQVLGSGRLRLLARHVLPNLASTVIVLATLYMPLVIGLEASLSFLGLGVPADVPTWGRIIADGQDVFVLAPWVAIAPGIAIVVASIGFNLLGDGMRDLLDIQLRR